MDTQDQAVESLVAAFESGLKPIVAQARRAVIEKLSARLSVVDSRIAKTKTNQRVLRSVAALFEQEMNRAGYTELVDHYVGQFGGQFAFFDHVLSDLGRTIGKDLTVTFGKRDQDFFEAQQMGSMHVLDGVVTQAATDAQRQALFSVGGLKLSDLISEIAEQLDKTVNEATTLADTAVVMFYRTITDRGFQLVEKDLPGFDLRYTPDGPLDKLTRPFCAALMRAARAGQTFTRKEIDAMDNGQIPGVFTSFGGFRCRHQWAVALDKK